MKNKKKKVCFIASSGGHLEEIKQLKDVYDEFDSYYIVAKSKSTQNSKEYRYNVIDYGRKNKIQLIITFFITCMQQLYIFIKERPDYIITSGPGMVVPTCFLGIIFRKKIIFIESMARISTPSKTGILLYKYSSLFLVQNENLKKYYPKAIYCGGVF